MPNGYVALVEKSPRSFLFYIVANVGPGGTSRPLAVAYRQGHDVTQSPLGRVKLVVEDIIRLIKILSEPGNRAPLEAERALAREFYQNQDANQPRHIVADSPQPPFDGLDEKWKPKTRPELPWDDSLREYPFTSTCLLLGLLQDSKHTRLGDVQLQPLSTAFDGNCLEYGMVVLDISNLERVEYGIVAFPVRYMAEVYYDDSDGGWDPVEDDPPEEEPDIVLTEDRPQMPLSILSWVEKYFHYMEDDSTVLELEKGPSVTASVLDYIWPLKQEKQRPSLSKEASHNPSSSENDRAIDNLLSLTRSDHQLEETATKVFKNNADLQKQLRHRLEEAPEQLGRSEASGHVLMIAYAGCIHLNWVLFHNISLDVIALAVASDELQGAAALSICVDKMEGDYKTLKATIARSNSLEQVCVLQKPDRKNDDEGTAVWAQLFSAENDWTPDKTILSTGAFSASLRNKPWLPLDVTPPLTFPVAYMLIRGANSKPRDRRYYMGDSLLIPERFAFGFLSYAQSVNSAKSLLQFAYRPSGSGANGSAGSVGPIPATAFDSLAKDTERVPEQKRLRDLRPGYWLVLVDAERRGKGKASKTVRYSFVKVLHAFSAMENGEQQQGSIEVVGSVKDFLSETISTSTFSRIQGLLEEKGKDVQLEIMDESDARAMFQDMWVA